jgi:hypothetical protein
MKNLDLIKAHASAPTLKSMTPKILVQLEAGLKEFSKNKPS